MTVHDALNALRQRPLQLLVGGWHWKSSVMSSVFRAAAFLCVNLTAGWKAATGAMLAEFVYRGLTAGFYGSLTQAFRKVEPEWHGRLAVSVLLPVVSHSAELAVHWARGTPNLWMSIAASVCFTAVSTQFHYHATRRGVFLVGEDSRSLMDDFRSVPSVLFSLLCTVFGVRRRCA